MGYVIGIVAVILALYCFSNDKGHLGLGLGGFAIMVFPGGPTSEPIYSILIGMAIILFAIGMAILDDKHERDGTNEKKRKDRDVIIEKERQKAIASQSSDVPWEIRYSIKPCPHCGHYRVRNAKWEDKQLSVAFWGAASGKIGKNFKCEHCGRMW